MKKYFADFDLKNFWDDSDYFTSPDEITDERVRQAEEKLGYKLPASYVELIKTKNGGSPENWCFPTHKRIAWAETHVAISGIKGLGGTWGIDSDVYGNKHAIEDGYYPNIGISVCECPSAGHDMLMLDYRKNGNDGEPEVVHVDVESDEPIISFLAKDFETFIKGLVGEEFFYKENRSN